MSPLFLLTLFASSFAVSSTRSPVCILSPGSIRALEGKLFKAWIDNQSLACHAKAKGTGGILGAGSSGRVEKVEVKGEVFAMKVYGLETENKSVFKEAIISTILSYDPEHHFVRPHYFFMSDEEERRLVMEYVAGGDLNHLCWRVWYLHWEDTISLAFLLLQALKYAHGQGVIYRDLKPENILLDAESGFKITDFDQASRFKKDKEYPKDAAGTGVYMAPEYFLNEPYTETVDTWTVGAVLWTAIEGRYMHEVDASDYEIAETFRKLINRSQPIPLPAAIPKKGLGGLYRNFLHKLLEFEFLDKTTQSRKKRPTCVEILESEEGSALFAAYEEETGKKVTELAFSPLVVEGKLKGYNYHGRQHEHYQRVLVKDSNIIPSKDGNGAT